MHVLISTSTFPITLEDGRPRFVYDLAEALTDHCEVTALAPDAPGARRQERMGEVDVRRFTYFRPRRWQDLAYGNGMPDNLRASFRCKLQALPFLWTQAAATRSLARERGIDVINSHWMIPQGVSTALACGPERRVGHVLTLHGSDVHLLRRLPMGRALARFVLSRTDFVFAVSSHVRKSLDELLGWDSKAIVQCNGVWVKLFRSEEGAGPIDSPFPGGFLLYLGRLIEVKGVSYLLRAMPSVLQRSPGVGLIVVGSGPLEGELRREAAQLGITGSVRFVGRQPYRQIIRYARACRVAVVPSIIDRYGKTEGMPTVVLEAMASGARVVGSAVDGIPDVIRHAENGWLCRDKDPHDLAEKILTALEDSPSSGVMRRIETTADQHDWSRVAARYAQILQRVANHVDTSNTERMGVGVDH